MIDLKAYKKEVEDLFIKNNIDKEEVNILFCEALNLSLPNLLLKAEIKNTQKSVINRAVNKRLKGMPIQKIFKRAYFYDYEFYINNNVLCPRPETELLVEECLKDIKNIDKTKNTNNCIKILDLCTGSGCIAITLAKKCNAMVFASDISTKALNVARKNSKLLSANVKFIKSNMFKSIKQKFDIIISNPPYISSCDCKHLDREVKDYDPKLALDGGKDGLDFYRIIASNAKIYLNDNGKIFLEVGINEAKNVKNMLAKNGFDCYIKKDYNNIDRIVVGELK